MSFAVAFEVLPRATGHDQRNGNREGSAHPPNDGIPMRYGHVCKAKDPRQYDHKEEPRGAPEACASGEVLKECFFFHR